MKYIASCSFGKDSLAMILKLIELGEPLDEVVFYDTGMEFQAIYNLRDKMIPIFEQHGIKYVELKPPYDFTYKMFDIPVIRNEERSCEHCKHLKNLSLSWSYCNNPKSKFYMKHDEYKGGLPSEKSPYGKGSCKLLELKQYSKFGYSWCGGTCRWGTTDKLKAIDKYAESLNAVVYVGIAVDELERLNKERKQYKQFPLAEWNMTEKDCLEYCYSKGFSWNESGIELYDILYRVSCWCCANKNLKELRNIYTYMPEYWDKLKALQSKTNRPMKGEGKSIFDLEKRFELEKEFLKQGKSITNRNFFKTLNRTKTN